MAHLAVGGARVPCAVVGGENDERRATALFKQQHFKFGPRRGGASSLTRGARSRRADLDARDGRTRSAPLGRRSGWAVSIRERLSLHGAEQETLCTLTWRPSIGRRAGESTGTLWAVLCACAGELDDEIPGQRHLGGGGPRCLKMIVLRVRTGGGAMTGGASLR